MSGHDMDAAPLDHGAIEQAAALITNANALVIAAGAGIGVDSGLPDFRGNAGFWKAYPALAADGTGFMDIASPAAFRRNPRRAWGFYGHRLALYRATIPHAGFGLLRKWSDALARGSFVFISNVDGQFQEAGFDPLRIDECHGSIHHMQCLAPCSEATWRATGFTPSVDAARCELLGALPTARTAAARRAPTSSCSTTGIGSTPGAKRKPRGARAGSRTLGGRSWSRSVPA
jgi:NAD-dependent SIR2 family protein deacetylase